MTASGNVQIMPPAGGAPDDKGSGFVPWLAGVAIVAAVCWSALEGAAAFAAVLLILKVGGLFWIYGKMRRKRRYG